MNSVPGLLAALVLGVALIAGDVVTWVGAYLYWSHLSLRFKVLYVVFSLVHLGLGVLWIIAAASIRRLRPSGWLRMLVATLVSAVILGVLLAELLAVHGVHGPRAADPDPAAAHVAPLSGLPPAP